MKCECNGSHSLNKNGTNDFVCKQKQNIHTLNIFVSLLDVLFIEELKN